MRSQHRSSPLPQILVACLMLVVGLALQAQQQFVPAPHKPIPPKVEKPIKWLTPAMRRSMIGGLWMTDANFNASIYLRNNVETDPVAVTPILHLSNGAKYILPDVTVKPADIAIISINDELQKKGISSFATLSGYLELEYVWPWDPFCATIRNVDVAHSLIFTYSLRPTLPLPLNLENFTPPAPTHTLEGMWWRHEKNVTGFVTVANLSSRPAEATIEVSDSEGRPVRQHNVIVSPNGMKLVNLPELQTIEGGQGGVRVLSSEPTDNLVVNGGLEDPAVGYSAILPFAAGFAKPSPEQLTIAELGLMVGAADPMMLFPAGTTFTPYSVVRNVSDSPVLATAKLWWMEGGQPRSASLPQIHLAPYETQSIDVPSLLSRFGPKNLSGSFNIVFEGQARPGALLLSSGSVDQTGSYVFEAVPRAVAEGASKSFQQWSTSNGDDTMFTLWNAADEAQDLKFTLFFEGGRYDLPLHMQPRETRGFNVSEIIQNQVPDAEGNLIPASVRQGTARLAGSQAENEHILIAADSGVYNVRKATCNNNCQVCDGYSSVAVIPNQFTVGVGNAAGLTFVGTWGNGRQDNLTSSAVWTSSSTSVATVDGTGAVTGVGPGSVTITAKVFNAPVQASNPPGTVLCTGPNGCPTTTFAAPSSGTVTNNTPMVTGIYPSDWMSGTTTLGVTFTGQYFGTNVPTLSFSPSNGISYGLVSYSDTQIVANITVAVGTPNEDVTVTVTNNGYGGLGFQSGGGRVSPTSAPVSASVHAPLNSPEVTVIAWVNGAAPDLNPLPGGANATLINNLNSSPSSCALELFKWGILNVSSDLNSSADRAYANAWLVKNSANTAPPSTITPLAQETGGNYRLFNDFGGGKGGYNIGKSPDPCGTGYIPNYVAAGQNSPYMGAYGTSPSGKKYQLAEGRIGYVGQRVSQTINSGRTVPWIFSTIEFDSSGNPTFSDHAMFPTYYVYVNGSLVATYAQSSVATFTAYDGNYQRIPSQIP